MAIGPYRSRKTTVAKRGGDTMGSSNLDSPAPRLVSDLQAKKEDKIRDELSGEADRIARSKVTLPKFSWDK